jgi:hypothetical protein
MYSTTYTAKAGVEHRQRTLSTTLKGLKKNKQEKAGALEGALVFFCGGLSLNFEGSAIFIPVEGKIEHGFKDKV